MKRANTMSTITVELIITMKTKFTSSNAEKAKISRPRPKPSTRRTLSLQTLARPKPSTRRALSLQPRRALGLQPRRALRRLKLVRPGPQIGGVLGLGLWAPILAILDLNWVGFGSQI